MHCIMRIYAVIITEFVNIIFIIFYIISYAFYWLGICIVILTITGVVILSMLLSRTELMYGILIL